MIRDKGESNLILYKAAVTNIVDGKSIGTSVLVKDYHTLQSAVRGADGFKLNNSAIVEVREYDLSQTAVIAWDDLMVDTGKTVYQNGTL